MTRREKILSLAARAAADSSAAAAECLVLPSMLLCDFAELRRETELLEAAGFRALHLDVMDGVFVPNFSYGMTIVQAFREATELPLDVHLMMVNPQRYIRQFYEAGADSLTVHIEAVEDPLAAIEEIHALGMAAGIAIDRDTPVADIEPVADRVDVVLVMTIKAGFGGQQFMPQLLNKLTEVRELAGPRPILQVDGGVNHDTVQACVEAGANWLVAGSAVFNSLDYRKTHQELLELACAGSKSRS